VEEAKIGVGTRREEWKKKEKLKKEQGTGRELEEVERGKV
jgi:hypothetical protein